MAKTIKVPVEYGYPTVTVWINDQRYEVETGKSVSVDDAVYLVLQKMMEKPAVPESTSSENYRIKFVQNGTGITCNKSHAEVLELAKSGANLIAEYNDGYMIAILHLTAIDLYEGAMSFASLWSIPGNTNNAATYIIFSKSGCSKSQYTLQGV